MPPKNVTGRRATVIGGARSGLAAAQLLSRQGAHVFVSDNAGGAPETEAILQADDIAFELGGHTDHALDAEFMVISPGVPSSVPLVQRALAGGIPVYSEIEVASWFCQAPIVAITGSNGKTTTTTLLGHVFHTAGRTAHVCGNIGYPFSDFASKARREDVMVLEVSSFQLEHIDTFRPRVSVLLNITPDHLDRYDHDIRKYAQTKYRIFENQRVGDTLIYNFDDHRIRDYVARVGPTMGMSLMAFSQKQPVAHGAFLRDGALVHRLNQQEETIMQAEELSLRGRHNAYNSMAASVAARVMELRSDVIRESLMRFEGVAHRLELVRSLDGVRYVNDSKATNVNAVWYALESFDSPIVLIAGGRDKGNDYDELKPLVHSKVRLLIALGESADKVMHELGHEAEHAVFAKTMDEAVSKARQAAQTGDVVLLSPACASFDMFENYENRGDVFRRLVLAL